MSRDQWEFPLSLTLNKLQVEVPHHHTKAVEGSSSAGMKCCRDEMLQGLNVQGSMGDSFCP
jgi:hypothetical protein